MNQAHVLWFTGLSGSGKTTIATALEAQLKKQRYRVTIIDGDSVRSQQHRHLGFTVADIVKNNQLIAELCLEKMLEYDYILVPVIAPFIKTRAETRKKIGSNYHEIYIETPIETCIQRDVKGLYQKALAGKITNFIGLDPVVPYEKPQNPEITITTAQTSVSQAIEAIMSYLNHVPQNRTNI